MGDDATDQTTTLSDDQTERVRTACERHDFPLREASLRRDVLTLTPQTLDGLPNADVLENLADELEEAGFRYVTFSVPEADETPK